jgi:hypothetical protein
VLGLYDQDGVLRFCGPDQADCLAYAELFAFAEGAFSIEPLFVGVEAGLTPRQEAGCSN